MMSTTTIFQVAVEFWGIVWCIIASVRIVFGKARLHANRSIKLMMQMLCILLLINDSLAYIFRGQPGNTAYYVVRISNYMVFFSNYIYMGVFSIFLWKSVGELNERMPGRIYATLGLSGLGVLLLTISQFRGLFYTFDADNYYHRGTWYVVAQLIAIVGMAIDLTILLQYRRRLERVLFYAILSYFVLPAITTVIMIFSYGLSLQNIAIMISTQIMFIMDTIDMSARLDHSHMALLHARYEAEHDAMTGLWNKVAGTAQIKKYIAQMQPEDVAALMFVDIDDFKSINDVYGHDAGDYWIREVAALLSNVGVEEDIVCRFGGDEYLVFMKSPADTETITTRFRQFKELLQFKALEMNQNVHCSVGICRMNGAGCEYEQCLKIADDALYEVKRNGKNNCVLFEAGRENTKERGKKIIDPTAALRMQEKFYRKIMNMFIAVVYYDAKDGTYEVLKECKPLHDKLPEGNRYSENVTVFVRLCADGGDQEAVCAFLAEQRIRNQTEPVVSMEYKNAAGGRALVHTFVNTETKEAGGKNCMIAFQDIYTV